MRSVTSIFNDLTSSHHIIDQPSNNTIDIDLRMKTVRLALDWTPNTNHIGFYIGLAKGWYAEKGIELEILPPTEKYENHETPDVKLEKGEVDVGITSTESLINMWINGSDKGRPLAIGTILADDVTALAVKRSSGISNLQGLDGKRYACFEFPYESEIVHQIVKNAGTDGNLIEVVPPKLRCYDAVVQDDADATWVFMNWEGLLAKKHHDMDLYPISECNIPYGYSTLIIASNRFLQDEGVVNAFLEVTSRGFEYAIHHPKEAVDCFMTAANHPELNRVGAEFVHESLDYLIQGNHFIDQEVKKWGVMNYDKIEDFIRFLFDHMLVVKNDGSLASEYDIKINAMFTNAYLPPV